MSQTLALPPSRFIDRRKNDGNDAPVTRERRQFTNSHDGLSSAAAELATAIDTYKLTHRRRFITYEEMLDVVTSIGYHK